MINSHKVCCGKKYNYFVKMHQSASKNPKIVVVYYDIRDTITK